MSPLAFLEDRPIVVALAGPNGAGKTTFFHAHLEDAGLRFVNADVLSCELHLDPQAAAHLADVLRHALLEAGASFIFGTVFSDPVGEGIAFLKKAEDAGFQVVLCFVGIAGPEVSVQRVSMRVSQGGHDVPDEKLHARYPRALANLRQAICEVPHVLVFDNDDLARPFRRVAVFDHGQRVEVADAAPAWLRSVL